MKGKLFEDLVEEIFKNQGYQTKRNLILEGKSGAKHEIDILAIKGKKKIAIECKYRENEEKVGKSEFATFLLKLDDLEIKEGYLVTNSYFSDNVLLLAKKYKIKLIDYSYFSNKYGNKLKEIKTKKNNLNIKDIILLTTQGQKILKEVYRTYRLARNILR
ncbi:MAG: hypothetical protein B6U78_02645 [Candidatus Aenigmarchaeota archaeon ex4484_224]|nr:MAG: hypothetical protein B6U78_02645 [Candidatus Aenigmarchaeota archaeon ex4484_224]